MQAIKFMYFAHNFSQEQLKEVFNVTSVPSHLESKFNTCKGTNGSEKFLSWFMLLSRDNQEAVVSYIDDNYKGMY